jgi:hypothetical protein
MNLLALSADVSLFWYLPPLVLAISLVYSGTRFESTRYIVIYGVRWSLYILTFLAATWAFIFTIGTGSYIAAPIAVAVLLFFLFGGGRSGKKASS